MANKKFMIHARKINTVNQMVSNLAMSGPNSNNVLSMANQTDKILRMFLSSLNDTESV